MRNLIILLSAITLLLGSCKRDTTKQVIEYKSHDQIQLIPMPREMNFNEAYFNIDKNTVIYTTKSTQKEAEFLKALIEEKSNFELVLRVTDKILPDTNANIWILKSEDIERNEEFQLSIESGAMLICAATNQGIMHGIQTIRQLFIDDFYAQNKRDNWCLPGIEISDFPTFDYRGFMLDCCRHFFSKEVVKKYIDLLALYKMNVFHWHLTEDQGWRIQMDKYPELTEIGAWRINEDGERYGGFYTKDEVREIVAYASERHITVIPEIELPGHSQAALATYPHLSCTGEQLEVENQWGVHKEIYCAGNDSAFIFLQDILTEVMELFPSEYIHIGGDEVPKKRWEECDKCQARIKTEGLKDEHELQSYFIQRIEKFLNAKGRKLIGWDEILEGGLAENATVQSWRGIKGGIAAATSGHDAIMSPAIYCYFNRDLKSISLERAYNYDHVPADLTEEQKKYIIGAECCMWTERVPDENDLDSKAFPRMLATSEILWAYPEKRDYEEFFHRVQYHYPVLEKLGVNYGLETIPVSVEIFEDDENTGLWVAPTAVSDYFEIKYKWICDSCTQNDYQKCGSKILVDRTGDLSFQAYKNGKKYGEPIEWPFAYHKALKKSASYKHGWSKKYPAAEANTLVDGRVGTLDYRDNNWQGFKGDDFDVVVDLGETEAVSYLKINFFQHSRDWIFLPENVVFEYSIDGNNYVQIADLKRQGSLEEGKKYIESFEVDKLEVEARYIRIKGVNIKTIPEWHNAAGHAAWLFADEIIVL